MYRASLVVQVIGIVAVIPDAFVAYVPAVPITNGLITVVVTEPAPT